ncbi:hypothetical protein OIU79_029630 [Salix purpurea]|uniref:Uncharacterized protein n=1 Tax=Salix purpurea TaxID=77065 RepID=A0A9Q0VJ94_SALPP|nr:hypothetical protein OIU79_029630 [Salix purpurea]
MASTSKKTTPSPPCCDSTTTPPPIRRDATSASSLVPQDWTVPSADRRPVVDSLPEPSQTASATKSISSLYLYLIISCFLFIFDKSIHSVSIFECFTSIVFEHPRDHRDILIKSA